MEKRYDFTDCARRLLWDLTAKSERTYYMYWLISQIPCSFGNMLRGFYLSKKLKSTGKNFKVYAGARFRSIENLIVGDNVEIGNDCFVQALGGVDIGNDVMLSPGVKIWSVNHRYNRKDEVIQKQGYIKSGVTIGSDVWISSNAFISPGVNIPDGAVIAAGSIVGIKKYPPYSIIAGNPARVIGHRE